MILWSAVASSNVAMIGYDAETSELHVKFNSGAEYAYYNVTQGTFDDFLAAPSKGRYLNEVIKGHYSYARV